MKPIILTLILLSSSACADETQCYPIPGISSTHFAVAVDWPSEPITMDETDTAEIVIHVLAQYQLSYSSNLQTSHARIRWAWDDADYLAITRFEPLEIVFNTKHVWTLTSDCRPGEFDFETVLLHEVGHLIGLNHSDKPGIMYPYIQWCERKRVCE